MNASFKRPVGFPVSMPYWRWFFFARSTSCLAGTAD